VFLLNPSGGIPLYVQLQQQLRQRILSGQLPNGAQLPSVRDLSAELHINPLTVVKVYQNLEREGFVESRRGIGTYVKLPSPTLSAGARLQAIAPTVQQLVTEAIHLGLSESEIQSLITAQYRETKRKPTKP
jgi:GntR family transcriptional regulator